MLSKKILIILAVIVILAAAVLALRFLSGPEDTWLCVNNAWVKHGNPSQTQPPATGCGDTSANQNTSVPTAADARCECTKALAGSTGYWYDPESGNCWSAQQQKFCQPNFTTQAECLKTCGNLWKKAHGSSQ
ncbi:MAG: hypothetical protein V1846_00385 [Candidatus Komeilibacteria bacterium]